jgi:hypothetical protein
MANDMTAQAVQASAAAAGVRLDSAAAARVAGAVSPTVGRFLAGDIAVSFDVEPATFIVVQHREQR